MNHFVTMKTKVKLGCYLAKECWWWFCAELCKSFYVGLLPDLLNIAIPQFQASVAWIRGLPVSSGPFSALCLLKS